MEDAAEMTQAQQPCSSGMSRKRKQPDEDDILLREGPLTAPPIDNEYEQLDEDDEGDEDQRNNIGRVEFERIKLAQEKATISQYDDIKVTPFNLDEELEEGQFDKAGNFIFKKKEVESDEDANDTWAESVNWAEVEKKERAGQSLVSQPPKKKDTDAQPTVINPGSKLNCYKEILRLMKPDETVKKTIQRLGQSVPKRKPFNKNAKAKKTDETPSDSPFIEDERLRLDRMIELAHIRLEDGDIDIYQKSYEDLEEAINEEYMTT